jgi:undecaprenyl-diphosphatase
MISTSFWQRGLKSVGIWFRERETTVLLGSMLAIVAVLSFIQIADWIDDGKTIPFDEWAIRALRRTNNLAEPIGSPWMQEMGRDASALGGVGWLVVCTLAVAGYLYLDAKRHMATFLLASASTGTILAFGLKTLFNRPRPDVVPHLSHVSSSSFPSAHSMMSAVVYITLGVLVATVVERRRLKIYILSLSLLLTMVVGVSRVYLGVHYPTDVLAGWMAGVAWALMCWLVARWLQCRGAVECVEGRENFMGTER